MSASSDVLIDGVDYSSVDKVEISKTLFFKINWQEILRAGVYLTHKEHQLLERAQENLALVMDSKVDGATLAKLLLKIADNCTSNVTVQQYIFTRIEEILGLSPDHTSSESEAFNIARVQLFADDGIQLHEGTFFRALLSSDSYTRQSAAICLSFLLSKLKGDDKRYCLWLVAQLSGNLNSLDSLLPAFSIYMRKREAREIFMENKGIKLLSSILSKVGPNGNAQHLYEICFAFWTLTLAGVPLSDKSIEVVFDYHVFLASSVIPLFSELIAAAPTKKVVRMAIATLKNLALSCNVDILTEMLNVRIDRQMETYINNNTHKQANDVEVEHDSKVLLDILLRNFRELSTFDKWVSELQSGALRWGIVHTEKFWRENAKLLEHDDFIYIKQLIIYLKSDHMKNVAIALYDLGEFSRFYSNGRVIAKSLGGKDLAMTLIESADPEVQRQALQCISKIMISNWDHMK